MEKFVYLAFDMPKVYLKRLQKSGRLDGAAVLWPGQCGGSHPGQGLSPPEAMAPSKTLNKCHGVEAVTLLSLSDVLLNLQCCRLPCCGSTSTRVVLRCWQCNCSDRSHLSYGNRSQVGRSSPFTHHSYMRCRSSNFTFYFTKSFDLFMIILEPLVIFK